MTQATSNAERLPRVAHLTTVHSPFDVRIFHKEARGLARAGYGVSLIVPHEREEVVDGVRLVPLRRPRNRVDRILFLAPRAFRAARREAAALYHLHDPELIPMGLLLKVLGHHVVYDAHEDIAQQILDKHWIPRPARRPLARLIGATVTGGARWFDGIVAATEGVAAGFKRPLPVVIRNYPDVGLFPPRETAAHEGALRIVYVGAISKERGALEMVRAMDLPPLVEGTCLDLVGAFQPRELESALRTKAGSSRVRYLGWMPPERVYAHLATCDVGLVCLHPKPRYMTALPVKLFEYMAAGLPVVASDFPLWRRIVEEAGCGLLVDPLDPAAIAGAIAYLQDHPEERERMGGNGRKAVLERYNWDHEAKTLLAVYKEILGEDR